MLLKMEIFSPFSPFVHKKMTFLDTKHAVFENGPQSVFFNARLSFSCRWMKTKVFEYGGVIGPVKNAIFFLLY